MSKNSKLVVVPLNYLTNKDLAIEFISEHTVEAKQLQNELDSGDSIFTIHYRSDGSCFITSSMDGSQHAENFICALAYIISRSQ